MNRRFVSIHHFFASSYRRFGGSYAFGVQYCVVDLRPLYWTSGQTANYSAARIVRYAVGLRALTAFFCMDVALRWRALVLPGNVFIGIPKRRATFGRLYVRFTMLKERMKLD